MIQNEYQGLGFPSDGVIKTGNKDWLGEGVTVIN
jgi:hypothetical protein